jgi:hypothetical protein
MLGAGLYPSPADFTVVGTEDSKALDERDGRGFVARRLARYGMKRPAWVMAVPRSRSRLVLAKGEQCGFPAPLLRRVIVDAEFP